MSAPTISRIENGRSSVRARSVRDLLDLYGVTDPAVRAELESLARQGGERGWWSAYASVINSGYSTLIGFEAGADAIDTYAAILVPGLLQTEAYARAVIEAGRPDLSADEVEQRIAVRVERQHRLREGLKLWAVLDEAILHRVVGGREVMAAQLDHLAGMARLPNVTVQVVPLTSGAHVGIVGEFTVIRVADTPDVVMCEMPTGTVAIEDPAEVRWYNEAINSLRAQGASPSETDRLIRAAAREHGQGEGKS